MKKLIISVLILTMLLSIVSIPTAAIPDGCTAQDITSEVKFSTVWQMYKNGTPIIRDDAKFVVANSFSTASVGGNGSGDRIVTITDFDDSKFADQAQFDYHNLGEGTFFYEGTIWPENAKDENGKAIPGSSKKVYEIEIAETGEYEFVFVGAAQITETNKGNPEKDRGFCYSVDGGQKYQVNISNSPLVFRGDYPYIYTTAEAEKEIADGTQVCYQMGYVYNIKAYLSAGKHTIEYYHLEYSGDTVTNAGNSSRLNFAGFYYQKYLDAVAFDNYKFPKAPEVTEPTPTTQAPETNAPDTKAPDTQGSDDPANTNNSGSNNNTPAPDTTKAPEEKGCGGMVAGGTIVLALMATAFVYKKRH